MIVHPLKLLLGEHDCAVSVLNNPLLESKVSEYACPHKTAAFVGRHCGRLLNATSYVCPLHLCVDTLRGHNTLSDTRVQCRCFVSFRFNDDESSRSAVRDNSS